MRKFSSALSFLLIGFFLVSLISCDQKKASSPILQEKVNMGGLVALAEKMKDDKDLTKEEIDLFSNGIQRLSFNKDSLNGKTVAQVIEMETQLRRAISYNGLLTSVTKSEMKMSLDFKFNNLEAKVLNNEQKTPIDSLTYSLLNISDKRIVKVQGLFHFQINGQSIKVFKINSENPIEPGKGIKLSQKLVMDQNSQKVYQAKNQNINMTTLFQPMYVQFEDGTELALKLAK